jgi:hypothetical protein
LGTSLRHPAQLSRPLAILLAPAHWLERARGRRRLVLVAVYSLVLALVGAVLWRQSRLSGLPEVSIAVDPRTILSISVPEVQNAFVLYRAARAKLKRDQTIERRIFGGAYAWPANDEAALAFLRSNDEAVELWRQGSERSDGLACPMADMLKPETSLPEHQVLRPFFWHARVRISREEACGDMGGAWRWYRALIRSSRLGARHAPWIGRVLGAAHDRAVVGLIAGWAADPRVDAPLLRAALHDVIEANKLTPPDRETLEIDALQAESVFNDSRYVARLFADDPWGTGEVDKTNWQNHLDALRRVRWFLANEPERSRRIIRLGFANLLEHWDEPLVTRPRLVGTAKTPQILFDARFQSPPEATAIDPSKLAAEWESAVLVKTLSLQSLGSIRAAMDRDHSQRARMVLEIARQVYAREHDGLLPENDEALVGECLSELPRDPLNDALRASGGNDSMMR